MDTTDFCQRIRAKCQQQRWYGPDMYVPAQLISELSEGGTYYWYDRSHRQYPITHQTDIDQIPTSRAFEYEPITEEQLQSAERLLGFSLPPLLRAIYTQVADGGFGPGYGLFHIVGENEHGEGENMVDSYLSYRSVYRLVDFHLFERRSSDRNVTLIPPYVWPDGFLCLCHWGCAIFSYLDIKTNRVFRQECYQAETLELDYEDGFQCEAPTLEVWLEAWLTAGIKMYNAL